MSKTVALTGATGFIGGHIARRLIAEGWTVRCLVRQTGAALPAGAEAVPGSLEDTQSLDRLVTGADVVIHCAGLVKARSREEFIDVNAGGTARVAEAARAAAASTAPASARTGRRFILISSLAAREPGLSDYAESKRQAEMEVEALSGDLDWTIVRPPGVYGPGDRETLVLFRQYGRGLAAIPATPGARVSLIHAQDLAAAVCCLAGDVAGAGDSAGDGSGTGEILEIDDGAANGYSWPEIIAAAEKGLGKRIFFLRIPLVILHIASVVNLNLSRAMGRVPMVTPGKVRELYHPDWVCRETGDKGIAGWQPEIGLEDGFAATFEWYGNEDWL